MDRINDDGVSTESGSDRVGIPGQGRDCQDDYPVATAPGTDLIARAISDDILRYLYAFKAN